MSTPPDRNLPPRDLPLDVEAAFAGIGARVVAPKLGKNVFVASSAIVCGDVVLGDDCTIMHHVTIRGDVSAIRIGSQVNVQDGTVIHTKTGVGLDIADRVGIGHRAVVHCRRVGSNTLIGIGAIVLDDAEIGAGCVIAAGALVPPRMVVPPGKVVMGMPARIVRDVTDDDRRYIDFVIDNYLRLNGLHAAGRFATWSAATAASE